MAPRAITFDMGYTLLEHAPTGPELYRLVLADCGLHFTDEALRAAHLPAIEHYVRSTRAGLEFEASMDQAIAFWGEFNAIILAALEVAPARRDEVSEKMYRRAWSPAAWRPFADTAPALEALRQRGIRLAIISNFVDTLVAVCRENGVLDYFDVVVASVDAGAQKPDPRIFRRALSRLGVKPEEAWHVGDNYWTDVLGARCVGINPVLLDRRGAVEKADCAVVRTLDELVELVDTAGDRAEAAA